MVHDAAPRAAAYASLAELRAVQARLGELRRKGAETAALWDAAADFVRRGAATGVVIDGDDERWSVQGLLDYWASALERAGRSRGDSSLAEFDPEQAPELPDDACPYLGLNAFEEAKGHLFFGRDALVAKLVHQLAEHRLVALVGPSGSGKSSLAFAGLVRGLRQGALPGSDAWRILPPMVPGEAPRAALAGRLAAGRDGDAALVLVVDQFEELFTMCESEAERAGFVADLVALVSAPSPPHRVVLTVRSDFESFVARHPALYERYAAGRVAVTPPSAAELRQAIEAPAALVGLKFEAGVIDRLLQELLGEPAGLPLLQFTLLRLWEERHRNRVTAVAYDRVGGGRQALARTADAVYGAMLPEDQATARRIFLMVGLAVDERHEATRTRVARARFFDHGDDPGRVERVLARLLAARLLRQTAGPQGTEPQAEARIEVAHEALVRNWPRLAEWLQEAQTRLAERRRLEAKAREWVRLGRGKSALMDEVELREAERWLDGAAGLGLRPSADLVALMAQSRRRVAAIARRRRLLLARLIVALIALAVMLVLTVVEYRKAQRALDSDRKRELENIHLVAEAAMEQGRALLLEGHVRPMRALPYLVEARARGIETPALRMLFAQAARGAPLVTLIGHADAVNQAAFSPDGTRVVTASDDDTARVWDAATGKPLTPPLMHPAAVVAAAFSPDGARVVTTSDDEAARVWDAATGQPVLVHRAAVVAVAFSPDSARVVIASKGWTVRVWDARTGQPVTGDLAQPAAVKAVRFSPDGARVIALSGDHEVRTWDARTGQPLTTELDRGGAAIVRSVTVGRDTARVWDARTGSPVTPPLTHQAAIWTAVFSPDGARVVTASDDRTARVWDAATGEPVGKPLEHDGHVVSAMFSPDGARVVTASDDDTARVWDARTGRAVTEPLDHQGRIRSAAFSPDGTRVVTASDDSTARIWEARSGVLVTVDLQEDPPTAAAASGDAVKDAAMRARWLSAGGRLVILLGSEISSPALAAPDAEVVGEDGVPQHDQAMSAAFSRDGTRLVTATAGDAARVWSALTGKPVTPPLPHGRPVIATAFSPDGGRVVTASFDGTARVWGATTGQPVTGPLQHQGPVVAAAFSPDGARVVTASADGTVQMWDATTGQPMTVQLPSYGQLQAAAFSPDGARVVTASFDGTAEVWNAATGNPVTAPLRHQGPVLTVAFSPDGARVITASADHTARIWDARTGQPVTPALEHRGPVAAAAFSPDGRRVVTASRDGTARIWDARTGKPVTGALEHQGAVLAAAFSADGTRVATASADGRARVWDAATGKPLTASLEHRGRVFAAVFSPDGTRVATGSGAFHGRIWQLPLDDGSLDDWRQIAGCSPFALVGGVFTANPEPRAVCQHRGAPRAGPPPGPR